MRTAFGFFAFLLLACACGMNAAESLDVSGTWDGRWGSSHPGHGGGLKCDAKKTGDDKWEAVFTAEFGRVKAYTVKLEGKREGDVVLFGGKVDLGKEDGGEFKWTGKCTATEFTGTYEGGGDKGTFAMKKKPAAPSK